jgi:hypothetical protein
MTTIRTVAAAGAALAGLIFSTVPATAASGWQLTRVSGSSPYATCVTPSHGETVAVNAEDSPVVASNPARRGNLVAGWEQDIWSMAGAHGAVAAYSFDNGRSWARTTLPFSTCAPDGGPYGRAVAPFVSIGVDGTVYAIGMSFAGVGRFPRSVESVVSTDGGIHWHTPRVLASYPAGGVRMAVTADPVRPGRAYVVWQVRQAKPDGTMHVQGYFARSSDHGRSWSAPITITGLGAEDAYNNHVLVDARTGRLYNTYTSCLDTCTIDYITSADHGRTWSGQHVVSDQHLVPITQPGTGTVVNTITPALSAISPSGEIVLAWEDSRFSGDRYNEIAVSRTTDGGRHWTTPHRASTPTGHPAFIPAVAISARGTIGVTYYDVSRDDPADRPFSTDVWATTSDDGIHFTTARHLAGSFDVLGAPPSVNGTLGVTQALTASGRRFVAVFEQTTCTAAPCPPDNPTDIYSNTFGTRPLDH